MKTISRHRSRPEVEADYLELVRQFPLRPLRSRVEHRQALEIVAGLARVGDAHLTDGQVDYLAALGRFVSDYEASHILPALGARGPLDVLHHLMDQRGMSPADLGDVLGSRPAATMILRGQRQMSKAHIRAAAAYFAVNPAAFF